MFRQLIHLLKIKMRYFKYYKTIPLNSKNNDLYIVEFPKSGITWFTTILINSFLLQSNIKISATHYNLEQFVGDIHQSRDISDNNIFPYYRLIKSHDVYNPYYRHVVYLIRNPFSVMNSYYHFAVSKNMFKGSISEFVDHPRFGIQKWVKHVDSWINSEKEMKFHLVKYEDLHDNAFLVMKYLFINLGLEIDDTIIKSATEKSSFNNMKKDNANYRKFSPFRKYDFVRSGKKKSELDEKCKQLIKNRAMNILESIYPENFEK